MKSSKLFRMTPVRGVWSGRIPALQEPTAREEDASISRLQSGLWKAHRSRGRLGEASQWPWGCFLIAVFLVGVCPRGPRWGRVLYVLVRTLGLESQTYEFSLCPFPAMPLRAINLYSLLGKPGSNSHASPPRPHRVVPRVKGMTYLKCLVKYVAQSKCWINHGKVGGGKFRAWSPVVETPRVGPRGGAEPAVRSSTRTARLRLAHPSNNPGAPVSPRVTDEETEVQRS